MIKPWENLKVEDPLINKRDPILGWKAKEGTYNFLPMHKSGNNFSLTIKQNGERENGNKNIKTKNEILLNKNVKFKSIDFSIETEKVIFDRNKQTAESKTKSLFTSKNTTISSDGFNIYDNGNKIMFYGNSLIVLK